MASHRCMTAPSASGAHFALRANSSARSTVRSEPTTAATDRRLMALPTDVPTHPDGQKGPDIAVRPLRRLPGRPWQARTADQRIKRAAHRVGALPRSQRRTPVSPCAPTQTTDWRSARDRRAGVRSGPKPAAQSAISTVEGPRFLRSLGRQLRSEGTDRGSHPRMEASGASVAQTAVRPRRRKIAAEGPGTTT